MNVRMLSAVTLCAGFLFSSAQAAITVIGPGPAQICYQAADMEASPADYMTFCNQALNGVLSDGDRAATFINRGVMKLALHDYDAAAADFNSGLAINTSMGEAYIDLGAVMIWHRQYEQAILSINKGLALGTKKPHLAYYDRAVADEALGNLQGAYDDYRQSLQLQPDFTKASDELKRFKIIDKPNGGA